MELLRFLLGLLDCANFNSLKNMLANWDAAQLFAVKYLLDKVRERDRNNERYENDFSGNFPDKDMWEIVREFDKLICKGNGGELIEIVNDYNKGNNNDYNGITFPPGLTEKDKEIIKDILDKNNGGNDHNINQDYNNGIVVVPTRPPKLPDNDDGNGNIRDDIFDNIGNPIINIPDEVIENITFEKKVFKCFEPEFKLGNYIFEDDNTFLTQTKIKNIKRMHYDILLPIYNLYYGNATTPSCQIKITFGLGGIKKTVGYASGSMFSKHLRGEAVDFLMVGIPPERVIKDIRSGKLNIKFGVLSPTNGLHITLPFESNGYKVENLIIESPGKNQSSLKIGFI